MLMNERKMENFDLSTQSVVDDIIKETETAGEEPDIVKSTKTRTPPDTLLIQSKPVAPPRKRKKTNLVCSILFLFIVC